jgi:PTS system nitrogen regulatory IIA component
MDLAEILRPDSVLPAFQAQDKRQVLRGLCDVLARQSKFKPADVFQAVWHREQLGSTGLGRGLAVPHGRLVGLSRMWCLFARLEPAIPYDSLDGDPVDLVFLLIGPEHAGTEHLKALARIARLMREPETTQKLRATQDRAAMYTILTASDAPLSRAG